MADCSYKGRLDQTNSIAIMTSAWDKPEEKGSLVSTGQEIMQEMTAKKAK